MCRARGSWRRAPSVPPRTSRSMAWTGARPRPPRHRPANSRRRTMTGRCRPRRGRGRTGRTSSSFGSPSLRRPMVRQLGTEGRCSSPAAPRCTRRGPSNPLRYQSRKSCRGKTACSRTHKCWSASGGKAGHLQHHHPRQPWPRSSSRRTAPSPKSPLLLLLLPPVQDAQRRPCGFRVA